MSVRHRAAMARSGVGSQPGADSTSGPDSGSGVGPRPDGESGPETAELTLFGPEPVGDGPGQVGDGPEPVGDGAEPVDDGLAAELTRAQPRRWWNRATPWLVAVLLLVGGFTAGAQVQRAYGTSPGANAGPGRGGGYGNGGPFGGAGYGGRANGYPGAGSRTGGGANGGGANGDSANGDSANGGSATGGAGRGGAVTTGTVKLVDKKTLYVQTASGDVITVRTDGGTVVQVPGKLGDLKQGDRVSVQGQQTGDGEMTASTVSGGR